MDLPQRPDHHVTGDQGPIIVRGSLPPRSVYRDLEGKSDYGLYAEIEIFDSAIPTGLLFRVQIRSHSTCSWNSDGTMVEPVKGSTRNYWRLQATPIVLIVCDTRARKAYWSFADEGDTSSGVRVRRNNELASTAEDLRAGVSLRLDMLGHAPPRRAPSWGHLRRVSEAPGGPRKRLLEDHDELEVQPLDDDGSPRGVDRVGRTEPAPFQTRYLNRVEVVFVDNRTRDRGAVLFRPKINRSGTIVTGGGRQPNQDSEPRASWRTFEARVMGEEVACQNGSKRHRLSRK
jgi:hypothetical protein